MVLDDSILLLTNQTPRYTQFFFGMDSGVQDLAFTQGGKAHLHKTFAYAYFSRFGSFIRWKERRIFLCHDFIEMPWNHTQRYSHRIDNTRCLDWVRSWKAPSRPLMSFFLVVLHGVLRCKEVANSGRSFVSRRSVYQCNVSFGNVVASSSSGRLK